MIVPPNEPAVQGNPDSVLCSAASEKRLRWRPWPCPECSQGSTPIGFLIGRIEAGSIFRETIPEKLAEAQVKQLSEWVESCRHTVAVPVTWPRIAEGSEHLVLFNEAETNVYKITRPGTFGDSYYLVRGKVHQRNCSPLEYLVRLRLWEKLFGVAPKDLGLTECGQIVSVQKYIVGLRPSQESVDAFLEACGLSDVKRACWLWKKPYQEFEIWVGDARDDNFVETSAGIVPIDLRIWFSSGRDYQDDLGSYGEPDLPYSIYSEAESLPPLLP